MYKRYPWRFYAIEANPKIIDRIPHKPGIEIVNKAIAASDGYITFFLDEADGLSTLIAKTTTTVEEIRVPSFDFGRWIKDNFRKEDYVIVSFDIQGAEYGVLDKMIKDRSIKYIDRFCIEFHPHLVKRTQRDDRRMIMSIEAAGVELFYDSVDSLAANNRWRDPPAD